jgi:hypothetical protein
MDIRLVAAAGLAAALLVGVAVAGIVLGSAASGPVASAPSRPAETGPVLLVPVAAPQAGSARCAALSRVLPATLANGNSPLRRRPLADPAPLAAAAWGGTTGDPVVLRCGIERPPELTRTSELLGVSGVQWFRVAGDASATWYAVDRATTIALTLPDGLNTGPIQDVSTAISTAIPAVQCSEVFRGQLHVQRSPDPLATAVSTSVVSRVG